MNVLFPSALLFRPLSMWKIIQFRMYFFTLHGISPLLIIRKAVLYDKCLVYSTSLVSNNYLDSNNCSVENNFHLLFNVLFLLLFKMLSVYPVENVFLYTSRHFPLVPNQKSCALCDNCHVYSTSIVFNVYLGSNRFSVDNNFHFSDECLVSICSSV